MASSIAKYGQTHPKINPQKVKKKKKVFICTGSLAPIICFPL